MKSPYQFDDMIDDIKRERDKEFEAMVEYLLEKIKPK
jgi:hypothetical protein